MLQPKAGRLEGPGGCRFVQTVVQTRTRECGPAHATRFERVQWASTRHLNIRSSYTHSTYVDAMHATNGIDSKLMYSRKLFNII